VSLADRFSPTNICFEKELGVRFQSYEVYMTEENQAIWKKCEALYFIDNLMGLE
jgi:hypothetical protein